MKSADKKKSRSSLFIVDNIKRRTFYFKDDYGKLWVEVIIVSFLDAVVICKCSVVHEANEANIVKITNLKKYILHHLSVL